jgi:hypothetical protein
MTARPRTLRLEAVGHWNKAAGRPVSEVVVAFGAATLTLKDIDERPLGHGALAGVNRRDPGDPRPRDVAGAAP